MLDGDGVLRHLRRINQCLLLRIRWRCRYCHDLVNPNHSIGLHVVIGQFGTRQSIQSESIHCLKRHGVPGLCWNCVQSLPLENRGSIWIPINARSCNSLVSHNQIQLVDVLILNSLLGIFHFSHVLFFLNPWIRYHGLYGACYAALCVGTPLLAFNLSSSYASSGSAPSESDDPSFATDWHSVRQVEIGCVGLLCCLWYSLETHVVVRKRHRFRFEQDQDCFFVMLCFAYADVWNVLAKCRLFVTKSSETTAQTGKVANTRANAERQLAA